MSAKRFDWAAFVEEFPVLVQAPNPIVSAGEVHLLESVSVARIDAQLLGWAPDQSDRGEWSHQTGQTWGRTSRAWLIASDGCSFEVPEGLTVGEYLLEVGPDAVNLVVTRNRDWDDQGGYDRMDLVVYKAPKSFTLREWVDQELARARDRLAGQIRAVDTVA